MNWMDKLHSTHVASAEDAAIALAETGRRTAMDDKTLVELFDEAYCALMAMRTDHPEKIWPTSFVYPDEVRNNAETMREAFEAQATRIEALEAALRGMCEAYKLVCDDAGMPYYTSPVSKYASAIKLLEGSGNG